jgi:flavin-dependent dehydrogenase
LAAAIALRQRGAAVTVADAIKPPIDKACGEGLMPDSLHELARLGVELTPADDAPFRGIRFVHGNDVATAKFPFDSGIGLRRQSLHARLVARAEEAESLCYGKARCSCWIAEKSASLERGSHTVG